MSVNSHKDDFREFVDTLVVALRTIEKSESPIRHIHPVAVREGGLSETGRSDFGLPQGDPVGLTSELPSIPILTEVGD